MMLRGGGSVDWNREWDLPRGIRGATTASTLVDIYRVWDNPDVPDAWETQVVPAAAVELRWPFVKATGGRAPRHRADRPGRLVPGDPRPAEHPERGQPPARVRRDQPLLAQPLPRARPQRDRAPGEPRDQLHPLRPRRLVARPYLGPRRPRHRDRRVRRGHRPLGPLVGLDRLGLARAPLGARPRQPRALRRRARLPSQRVRPRLRRQLRCRCAPPTPTSPRTTPTRSLAPSPRPTSSPSTRGSASTATGSSAACGATTSRRTATSAPGPASPMATSAPSSTFRSRAATPHRLTCRPRRRSASPFGCRASAAAAEIDWPARVCTPRGT